MEQVLLMRNKTYDALKIVALVALPLLNILYGGLAAAWGWEWSDQINGTIQTLIAAANLLLGVALVKSSNDYKKGEIDHDDKSE